MVGFHHFAAGLQTRIAEKKETAVVATIRAMMTYIALLHTLLFLKIRSRKRQIDILVHIREIKKSGIIMYSSFNKKKICWRDI